MSLGLVPHRLYFTTALTKRTPSVGAHICWTTGDQDYTYNCRFVVAASDRLLFDAESTDIRGSAQPGVAWFLGAGQYESNLGRYIEESSNEFGVATARHVLQCLLGFGWYHFHDTSLNSAIRLSQDINRHGILDAGGGNLAAFLNRLRVTDQQHFSRIESHVRMAVPFFKEFRLRPDPLNQERILLRWADRTGEEFGPHQLSGGSLRAIALITALLQPESTMPSLMLIDEPELGLHPSAICLIASLIKAAATRRQIIVATQSPGLLSEFHPGDILVAERHEDAAGYGETVFNRLSAEELGAWLSDYNLGALYEMQVNGGGTQ